MSAKVVLFLLLVRWSCAIETERCRDLGFVGDPLCSDCNRLQDYVRDTELFQDCKGCCQGGDIKDASAGFEKAILEVCKHRLREFPQVEGFIRSNLETYNTVKVSYKFGSFPRLILQSSALRKEAIRIDSWTTDNIVEFLDSKLIPTQT